MEKIEEKFLSDLKSSIVLEDAKSLKKPSQTYKPSSLNCIRNMYYQITGADCEQAPKNHCAVNICKMGSELHLILQKEIDKMKENGFNWEYVDVETYIKEHNIKGVTVLNKSLMETKLHIDDLNMTFMCDGILKNGDKYYLLEIKTETTNKFTTRFEVDKNHYYQARAYSYSLGIDDVIFLYCNRDFVDMKAFLYTPTKEEKQEFVDKLKLCDSYVAKKECPPKPDNASTTLCRYCIYKQLCDSQ